MKRKSLIPAIALLLVVSAALWGVNYRLNNPPLSDADKEFRALVAGTDSVKVSQESEQQQAIPTKFLIKYKPLNATQAREFIEILRLLPEPHGGRPIGIFNSPKKFPVTLYLSFSRSDKELASLELSQTTTSTVFSCHDSTQTKFYKVNPRFNKRLNRALDAYLPQRIRP